jgi:hypothetical protein
MCEVGGSWDGTAGAGDKEGEILMCCSDRNEEKDRERGVRGKKEGNFAVLSSVRRRERRRRKRV